VRIIILNKDGSQEVATYESLLYECSTDGSTCLVCGQCVACRSFCRVNREPSGVHIIQR
jgi:ferredoxin